MTDFIAFLIYCGGVAHYLRAGRRIVLALSWPWDMGRALAKWGLKMGIADDTDR